MKITVGAKCWDGTRRKSFDVERYRKEAEVLPEQTFRRRNVFRSLRNIEIVGPGLGTLIALSLTNVMPTATAFAAAPDAVPAMAPEVANRIMHVFDPLIKLVVSLSYPVAGIMIAGGCLMIMVQQREAGMKMLQNAAIGYILVQLSPMFLELLVGIGSSV